MDKLIKTLVLASVVESIILLIATVGAVYYFNVNVHGMLDHVTGEIIVASLFGLFASCLATAFSIYFGVRSTESKCDSLDSGRDL